MRFYSWLVVLAVIFLCFLFKNGGGICENRNLIKACKKKSFVQLILTKNLTTYNDDRKGICRWLKELKHQSRLCKRRKGLAEIIKATRELTLNSCTHHFQYEQWPCLRLKRVFKKVYRETAFVYSLTTAAFMWLVARACAAGMLQDCACAETARKPSTGHAHLNVSAGGWRWGGCGDNTKFAKRMTSKFFQLKKRGDKTQNILKYSSEVGVKTVIRSEQKVCKCHGLSGSCTYRICFKRLQPFAVITEHLKSRYHSAERITSDNDLWRPPNQKEWHEEEKVTPDTLRYLDTGPNWCQFTVGRRCKDTDNCATLCCGRGIRLERTTITEPCRCRWRNDTAYQVICEQCDKEETVYHCQ
nr:unnamed protein product [Callosobruchus analis]